MIPDDVIDKLLNRTDIVEVISGYLPLKRAGQNYKALCPFHKEKTPSFVVSPAKQIYHCFGCGAGGNVIGFIMKYENLNFGEAVRLLARKVDITIPSVLKDARREGIFNRLYAVCEIATSFYQDNLFKPNATEAYRYILQRGLNELTIKQFRIGYAQEAWQNMLNYCRSKGFDEGVLEKCGLVVHNQDKSSWYDRFRKSIIFPIADLKGRIVAFGARLLEENSELPKYTNSPETTIYTKGNIMYGLNLSKEYIREKDYVIIVEGYFDMILPYQSGIKNIVATLGTALTINQINILKRFTKNVIMVYDADKAGESAMLRGLDLLLEQDMNVRIAALPQGEDPDSYVRKEGKDGFMKLLKYSRDIFDYKLGILIDRFKKTEPRGKARIVLEMLPTLARINNAVLKSAYIKRLSEILSIDEESIRAELRKVKIDTLQERHAVYEKLVPKDTAPTYQAEITLLGIVMNDPHYLRKVEEDFGISNFKNKTIYSIMKRIKELCDAGKRINPSHLISYLEGDLLVERIILDAMDKQEVLHDKEKVFQDCITHLRELALKDMLSDMQVKIKEAEISQDFELLKKLVNEYNQLIKEIKR